MAIVVIGIEVDSIDCYRGKQDSSGMFPIVVALIYIGVWLVRSLYISRLLSLRDNIESK